MSQLIKIASGERDEHGDYDTVFTLNYRPLWSRHEKSITLLARTRNFWAYGHHYYVWYDAATGKPISSWRIKYCLSRAVASMIKELDTDALRKLRERRIERAQRLLRKADT